jgi:hypothetical protein
LVAAGSGFGAPKRLRTDALRADAGNATSQQAQQKAGPDALVYVDGINLVRPGLILGAEETVSRMFAGIGLRVQWTVHPPAQAPEPAGTQCTSVGPEVIVIQMASERPKSAIGEALASARPYARSGTRITVFYGELQEAISRRPSLERVLLAHVLVHEITHVLQGVVRHSSTGVTRAHWALKDYADMQHRPLEFTAIDVQLIRASQAKRGAEACILARGTPNSGSGQAVPQ